jgi:hypothetical protein
VKRKPRDTEPTAVDDVRVGAAYEERDQAIARAVNAEAALRFADAEKADLQEEIARLIHERNAAQDQLAAHLKTCDSLGGPPRTWTEVAPAPAAASQPLPKPVKDTWTPPPLTDWTPGGEWDRACDDVERALDVLGSGPLPTGTNGTGP